MVDFEASGSLVGLEIDIGIDRRVRYGAHPDRAAAGGIPSFSLDPSRLVHLDAGRRAFDDLVLHLVARVGRGECVLDLHSFVIAEIRCGRRTGLGYGDAFEGLDDHDRRAGLDVGIVAGNRPHPGLTDRNAFDVALGVDRRDRGVLGGPVYVALGRAGGGKLGGRTDLRILFKDYGVRGKGESRHGDYFIDHRDKAGGLFVRIGDGSRSDAGLAAAQRAYHSVLHGGDRGGACRPRDACIRRVGGGDGGRELRRLSAEYGDILVIE